jgi:hypothetical protein
MIKLPRVIGLHLCKSLGVDTASAELSLVGIFHSLTFSVWPAPAQPFTAYALLHDGAGEGTMELVVNRLETEEDVYRQRRWFALPGRGLLIHLETRVRRCVFPAPGRYTFTLRFDGKDLAQRPLDVYAKEGTS